MMPGDGHGIRDQRPYRKSIMGLSVIFSIAAVPINDSGTQVILNTGKELSAGGGGEGAYSYLTRIHYY